MAERRGMGAAMALSQDKLEFIKRGVLPPEPVQSEIAVVDPPEETVRIQVAEGEKEPIDDFSTEESSPGKKPRSRRSASRNESEHSQSLVTGAYYEGIRVPFTTRVKIGTAAALRRACLERKLAGESPNTHQEIIEIALNQWLKSHDFLA